MKRPLRLVLRFSLLAVALSAAAIIFAPPAATNSPYESALSSPAGSLAIASPVPCPNTMCDESTGQRCVYNPETKCKRAPNVTVCIIGVDPRC